MIGLLLWLESDMYNFHEPAQRLEMSEVPHPFPSPRMPVKIMPFLKERNIFMPLFQAFAGIEPPLKH